MFNAIQPFYHTLFLALSPPPPPSKKKIKVGKFYDYDKNVFHVLLGDNWIPPPPPPLILAKILKDGVFLSFFRSIYVRLG